MLTSPVGDGPSLVPMHGWNGKLLKDWTLSGGVTASSGTPVHRRGAGQPVRRRRHRRGGQRPRRRHRPAGIDWRRGFFNPAAFTLPPLAGAYGNAGRNTIPGPGAFRLNVSRSAARSASASAASIEFRVEAQQRAQHVNITRYRHHGERRPTTAWPPAPPAMRNHAPRNLRLPVLDHEKHIAVHHAASSAAPLAARRPQQPAGRRSSSRSPRGWWWSNVAVRDRQRTARSKTSRQSDFTVLEDGKPQKISVFEYQRLESAPLAAAAPSAAPRAARARRPPAAAEPSPRPSPARCSYKDRRLHGAVLRLLLHAARPTRSARRRPP